MKLVGTNNPSWDDMSNHVVHFSKAEKNLTAYDNMLSILAHGRIEARNRFGIARKKTNTPKSVCFSEIPLHKLSRIAMKRGPYGIVFSKEFLVKKSAGPILYAYKSTKQRASASALMELAAGDPDHPFWQLAPFIDAPGTYGTGQYFFEWEREWRLAKDLDFEPNDAFFLIIPEDQHELARSFFDNAEAENIGPNYTCKFIDPYWDLEKISSALKSPVKIT